MGTSHTIDNTYAEVSAALPPVTHEGQQMIDARGLHARLGVDARFNDWFRRRVKEYGLAEGFDFVCYSTVSSGRGGHNKKSYLLTLDTAKELAMVERTEVGRMTRRYFIKMEQSAVKMASDHVERGTPELIPQDFFDARAGSAASSRQKLRCAVDCSLKPVQHGSEKMAIAYQRLISTPCGAPAAI